MDACSMQGGFANPPVDSATAFRAAIDAMSRPGTVHRVAGAEAPAPLSSAAAVLALTLCDPDTPVWLAESLEVPVIRDWFSFHIGAPFVARGEAMFAFGRWDELLPVTDFRIGSPEYPDRSATLIVELDAFGRAHRLTGPGVRDYAMLSVPDLAMFQTNAKLFPLGLDFFLCSGDRLAGVPRTTIAGG